MGIQYGLTILSFRSNYAQECLGHGAPVALAFARCLLVHLSSSKAAHSSSGVTVPISYAHPQASGYRNPGGLVNSDQICPLSSPPLTRESTRVVPTPLKCFSLRLQRERQRFQGQLLRSAWLGLPFSTIISLILIRSKILYKESCFLMKTQLVFTQNLDMRVNLLTDLLYIGIQS